MAFLIGKRYLFLVVLIIISLLSSSLHARELQRFSQMASTAINNKDNAPQFVSGNSAYGLYSREEKEPKTHPSPAATVNGSPPPPLPKNYNPVAYLTVAEDPEEDKTFVSNKKEEEVGDATFDHSTTLAHKSSTNFFNNYYGTTPPNNPYFHKSQMQEDTENLEDDDDTKHYFETSDLLNQNLYPSQKLDKFGNSKLFNNNNGEYYQPEEEEEKSEPSSQTTTNNKYYKESSQYYGNSQQQQNEENKFNNYFNNEETSRFHKPYTKYDQKESLPQGMSDTRTLQNGMYHYNPYSNRYNKNHPYRYYNNFRNNENANRYQQQEEEYQTTSQDEEMP